MLGPSHQGPPPEWAVAPPAEPGDNPQGAAPWHGDVGDGVEAWLRAVAAGEFVTTDQPGRADPESGLGPDGHESGRESADGSDDWVDHEAVARKILLDQLTGQARSRKELADRLAKKNVPDEIACRLLDRFEEIGLINDASFARAWIASRQPGKGLARRALAQELRRKGIDDMVAREALDEIDPDDEEAAARRLVRKRMRTMRALDSTTATRRLVAMLGRKGYRPGVCFTVVREELAAADDDESPTENPRDW